ncbi:MAG TPA: hypothetical protein VGK51_11445, partial [Actinomycetota bacterium]
PSPAPPPLGQVCSLDGATPTVCSSPVTYTALAAGQHKLVVTATDTEGPTTNTGSGSFTWRVDTTAPAVTITDHPSDPSTTTTATFGFTATDPDDTSGSLTFACSIDAVMPTPCTSPVTYTGLTTGQHTFTVRSTDPAGNVSPPQSFMWMIQ